MTQPFEPDDPTALIYADRELTPAEQARLDEYAQDVFSDADFLGTRRAITTYSVADREDFILCANEHMNPRARAAMAAADIYNCPQCGRLLKDRRTPVASSVLQERRRLREIYLTYLEMPDGPEREELHLRFLANLGVTR